MLKKQKSISHNSGDSKSKIKVLARLVSDESSLLGMQTTTFSCVLTWPFLCEYVEREVGIFGFCSFSYKDISSLRLGPYSVTI